MIRQARLVPVLVALLLGLSACRPRTVEIYQKDGVRFSHHSDWKIDKDNPLAGASGARMITVEGPDNALLMLFLFPEATSLDLARFAENVASKRAGAVEKKLSVGPVQAGHETPGGAQEMTTKIAGQQARGIQQDFTLEMLGQKVPHQAAFYMFPGGHFKVVVMTQVATEHLGATQPSWQLIFDTLAFEGPR